MEKKYEKNVKRNKRDNFRCHNCGEKFESVSELKKHKTDGCQGDFQCDECDKKFQQETLLDKHKVTHKKFECDDCDKNFKNEGTLQKHIQAAHEDITLYCHFFNNDKECPYDDECIFVHEDSVECRFGRGCERNLCMFKHEGRTGEEDESDESEDDSDGDEESIDLDVEDIKPVMEKLEEAFEKLSVDLKNILDH